MKETKIFVASGWCCAINGFCGLLLFFFYKFEKTAKNVIQIDWPFEKTAATLFQYLE